MLMDALTNAKSGCRPFFQFWNVLSLTTGEPLSSEQMQTTIAKCVAAKGATEYLSDYLQSLHTNISIFRENLECPSISISVQLAPSAVFATLDHQYLLLTAALGVAGILTRL